MLKTHASRYADNTCSQCQLAIFCQQQEISPVLSVKKNMRNQFIYTPHTPFQHIYAIRSGAIKVLHINQEGDERIVQFYFKGEVFGFDAIYAERYSYSALALASSQICQIPYSRLLQLFELNPQYYAHLLKLVSQQLSFGHYVTHYSAEQRVACFLLELYQRLHINKTVFEFELPMSRCSIGNYLNFSAETISRVFTRLQQKRLIWTTQKKIKILDLSALQRLAQNELLVY